MIKLICTSLIGYIFTLQKLGKKVANKAEIALLKVARKAEKLKKKIEAEESSSDSSITKPSSATQEKKVTKVDKKGTDSDSETSSK